MKVIYGCGFVMIDDPFLPYEKRADFWFCQAERAGRVLLQSRNAISRRLMIKKFRDRLDTPQVV